MQEPVYVATSGPKRDPLKSKMVNESTCACKNSVVGCSKARKIHQVSFYKDSGW